MPLTPEAAARYQVTFSTNIELAAQQMGSKLLQTITVDNLDGEKKYYDHYGLVSGYEKLGYADEIQDTQTDRNRIAISPRTFVHNEYFDIDDDVRLGSASEPNSTYMQAIAAWTGRQMDDVIIAAYTAATTSGQEGAETNTYDTSRDIAVGFDQPTGSSTEVMTRNKIREAARLHRVANVEGPYWLVLHAIQHANLLTEDVIINNDYIMSQVVSTGQLPIVDEHRIIWCNQIPQDSTTGGDSRYYYSYVNSAMIGGRFRGVRTTIDRMPGRHNATLVQTHMTFAAARRFEDRIVRGLAQRDNSA